MRGEYYASQVESMRGGFELNIQIFWIIWVKYSRVLKYFNNANNASIGSNASNYLHYLHVFMWVMQVITHIIWSIHDIHIIWNYEYFELNNNPMRVMRGGFKASIGPMWVMRVFKLRRGGSPLAMPLNASICKYFNISNIYSSLLSFVCRVWLVIQSQGITVFEQFALRLATKL